MSAGVIENPLVYTQAPPQATFVSRPDGRPGLIDYQTNCYLELVREAWTQATPILNIEQSLLGPDGTVYYQASTKPNPPTWGGPTGSTIGGSCTATTFHDDDLSRPTATLLRVRIDYSVAGSTRTLEVERTVEATVPQRPIMTGLVLTDDAANHQGLGLPVWDGRTPLHIVARGTGGRTPYEYQWRIAGSVARDWSTSGTFTLDGSPSGTLSTGSFFDVFARSAGSTTTEVKVSTFVVLTP